jgi:lysophospholipase L1-like esterase
MQRRSFLPALVGFFLLPAAWAQAPATPAKKWTPEPEIAAFVAKDKENPPPKGAILFIGSSSIRLWKDVDKDFPQHRVINRGFGSSMISDCVKFADQIAIPYEPRAIFFFCGGNDINAGKSPETVAGDFRAFVEKVHAKLPNTEINFISSSPNPKRWAQIEKVRALNALVEQYCKATPHLHYVDVYSKMLGPDGQPKQGIYRDDQLHMNAEGYKIWVEVLRPLLPPPDVKSAASH